MLPLDVGKEILILLKSCLKYPTIIRSNLYENLKEIIPTLDNEELTSQIHNILSPVLNSYISDDEILLLTCFEDVGVESNQDYILKESIHKLFQCIFKLNGKKTLKLTLFKQKSPMNPLLMGHSVNYLILNTFLNSFKVD
jgi:hypothetical protein